MRDSVPPATTKKRGLEFIEYGDSYEPGTQMQRGYQRAARRTPVFEDEAHESPIQNDLTDNIDLVPPAKLSEPSEEALEQSTGADEWAEMEAQWRNEENALLILQNEALVDF